MIQGSGGTKGRSLLSPCTKHAIPRERSRPLRSRLLRALSARRRLQRESAVGLPAQDSVPRRAALSLDGLPLNGGGGHLRNSLGVAERDPTRNGSGLGQKRLVQLLPSCLATSSGFGRLHRDALPRPESRRSLLLPAYAEVSAGMVKKVRMAATTGRSKLLPTAHKNQRSLDRHLDFFDHIPQALLGGGKPEADRYLAQSSPTDWQAAPRAQGSGPFRGVCAPHLL